MLDVELSVALVVPEPLLAEPLLAENLAALDDRALLGLVATLPIASVGRAAACEILVIRYRPLVWSCVRPFRHSPESVDDLMQVAYIGLLKAISNFDPAICSSLSAYARPCITGELKRHFRDKRWQVHVKRSVQDLAVEVRKATWQLAQELGRIPADTDLARYLGVSEDEVRHAHGATLAFQPGSLDAPVAGLSGVRTVADLLGQEDPELERMLGMHAVAAHWDELPPREQEILLMDFRSNMTQVQIGRQLGISQMHVSRLRTRALGYLRSCLLDPEERAS